MTHRDAVVVLGPGVDGRIQRGEDDLAIGDWVVLNSEGIADSKARERGFGRMAREVMADTARRRGDR